MKITVFLNNGKMAVMPCPLFSNGDMQTLARQISRCDLVHTARAQDHDADRGLDYQNGFTTEGA